MPVLIILGPYEYNSERSELRTLSLISVGQDKVAYNSGMMTYTAKNEFEKTEYVNSRDYNKKSSPCNLPLGYIQNRARAMTARRGHPAVVTFGMELQTGLWPGKVLKSSG